MKSAFKVGDKIRCIDVDINGATTFSLEKYGLYVGGVYTVKDSCVRHSSTSAVLIRVEGVRGITPFQNRFVRVFQTPREQFDQFLNTIT
jgi:hypothetical protein